MLGQGPSFLAQKLQHDQMPKILKLLICQQMKLEVIDIFVVALTDYNGTLINLSTSVSAVQHDPNIHYIPYSELVLPMFYFLHISCQLLHS